MISLLYEAGASSRSPKLASSTPLQLGDDVSTAFAAALQESAEAKRPAAPGGPGGVAAGMAPGVMDKGEASTEITMSRLLRSLNGLRSCLDAGEPIDPDQLFHLTRLMDKLGRSTGIEAVPADKASLEQLAARAANTTTGDKLMSALAPLALDLMAGKATNTDAATDQSAKAFGERLGGFMAALADGDLAKLGLNGKTIGEKLRAALDSLINAPRFMSEEEAERFAAGASDTGGTEGDRTPAAGEAAGIDAPAQDDPPTAGGAVASHAAAFRASVVAYELLQVQLGSAAPGLELVS